VPPPDESRSLPSDVKELWELVAAYFRQETLDPVKSLGRFVLFGVAGSLVLGIGLVLLVLASLRVLQTETGGFFRHTHTWAPYAITLAVCLAVAGAAMGAWVRGQRNRRETGR